MVGVAVTDPSPDCGYTDAEQAPADGLRAAIAVYVAVVADEDASESAVLEADRALAEQTQRKDQAWEEIARLREFGEHYSGAAQDAWDRIVVLEKREAALEAALVEVGGGWRDAETPPCFCRGDSTTESLARCTRIRNLLTPAGSASPGGAET